MRAPGGRQDLAGWVRGRGSRVTAEPTWVRTLACLSHKELHTSLWDLDRSSGVSKEHVLQQVTEPRRLCPARQPAQWVSFPFLAILCQPPAPTIPSSRGGSAVFLGEGQAPQGSRGAASWATPPRSGARTSQSQPTGPWPRRGTWWSRRSWGFRMSEGTGQRSPAWSPPHPVHVRSGGFTVSVWKPERVGAFHGDSASLGPRPPGTARALPAAGAALFALRPISTAVTEAQIIGSVMFLKKTR